MNRVILFIFLLFLNAQFVSAQIELGVKAGVNASRSIFDDDYYKQVTTSKYKPGYFVGLVGIFNNSENEKYALQTELVYARIGRKVKNIEEQKPNITINKASYDYLQLPIMFVIRFKQSQFDWYVQLGPQINYWFGGRGTYGVFDPNRQTINEYNYRLNFKEPKDDFDYMNVSDFNRFQLGLSVGAGIVREINETDNMTIGLRYYFGHSYLGVEDGGEIPNASLFDNFESTNQTLELSVAYTFDFYEKMKRIRRELH